MENNTLPVKVDNQVVVFEEKKSNVQKIKDYGTKLFKNVKDSFTVNTITTILKPAINTVTDIIEDNDEIINKVLFNLFKNVDLQPDEKALFLIYPHNNEIRSKVVTIVVKEINGEEFEVINRNIPIKLEQKNGIKEYKFIKTSQVLIEILKQFTTMKITNEDLQNLKKYGDGENN